MNISVSFYRKFLLFSLITVCLLILAGGVVRSTGSGMGCPDWPKCFGQWIPPTDGSELPANYQEIYSQKRQAKNLRLTGYFEMLGFTELVDKLKNDPSILEEERFNATKTWIEYINRLLGAVVGILFLLNVFFAFRLRQKNKVFLTVALINLVLVGFQGWVGSIVVSTNLLGGMITFHMLLALLILAVLIYNYWSTNDRSEVLIRGDKDVQKLYRVLLVGTVLFTIQVALGTQVRESIDMVAKVLGEASRSDWIEELGLTFYVHRSFSLLILALHLYFGYQMLQLFDRAALRWLVYGLISLLALEILSGVVMAYFAIPAAMQPIHLLLATLIFGIDFMLILELRSIIKFQPIEGELKSSPKDVLGHIY